MQVDTDNGGWSTEPILQTNNDSKLTPMQDIQENIIQYDIFDEIKKKKKEGKLKK